VKHVDVRVDAFEVVNEEEEEVARGLLFGLDDGLPCERVIDFDGVQLTKRD
jgi:hypothetical protein